jgi:hypothetical protein
MIAVSCRFVIYSLIFALIFLSSCSKQKGCEAMVGRWTMKAMNSSGFYEYIEIKEIEGNYSYMHKYRSYEAAESIAITCEGGEFIFYGEPLIKMLDDGKSIWVGGEIFYRK